MPPIRLVKGLAFEGRCMRTEVTSFPKAGVVPTSAASDPASNEVSQTTATMVAMNANRFTLLAQHIDFAVPNADNQFGTPISIQIRQQRRTHRCVELHAPNCLCPIARIP